MKKAVVIGAGFGGLALAIRLQSAGIAHDRDRRPRPARRTRLLLGPGRLHIRRRADSDHGPRLPARPLGAVGP